MKLSITGGDTFTLTGQVIDKLIRADSGDAALLYLYILRTHGQSTDMQAAEALGKSKGQIADATALLSRMGLLDIAADKHEFSHRAPSRTTSTEKAAEPVREPKDYTQEEIIAEIESGSAFTIVIEETKRRLGKPLTADDMLRLYSIYDNLRLPPEVILQLITHCINECRGSGDGRTPSIRYIEKAAYTWEREGVFSIERAEEYLKALEARKSARGKIKQVLQIRDREFSETEKSYVDKWIKMGFEPEAIAIAYDKTVVNTGGLKYQYMDTILSKWNEKGLRTEQQVRSNEKGNQRTTGGSYSSRTSRNQGNKTHGEPNREELERMRKLREKMDS